MCLLGSKGFCVLTASLIIQVVKNQPAMWETWVRSLGWEDALEKGEATQSSILAWRVLWTIYSPWVTKSQHNRAPFTFTTPCVRGQSGAFLPGVRNFNPDAWVPRNIAKSTALLTAEDSPPTLRLLCVFSKPCSWLRSECSWP